MCLNHDLYFFWVSSLAFPNLLRKKSYVVVVVVVVVVVKPRINGSFRLQNAHEQLSPL